MRRAGLTASTLLAATVFVAPAMSHPRGAAPDPDAERSPETPAELAAFVTDCAARLGAKDVGLARVALQCPGIEYHLEYGPLGRSARGSSWARHVNAEQLRGWAAVAAGYGTVPVRVAPAATALAPLLARAEETQLSAKSLWQRWLEKIEAFVSRQRQEGNRSAWLERLFKSVGAGMPSAERIRTVINTGLLLLAAGLLVYFLRAGRVWQRLKTRAAEIGGTDPRPETARSGSLPDSLPQRVAARFAVAIEWIDSEGVVPGARARTCRELAARLAVEPRVAALAPLAPLVEQVSFAAVMPETAVLVAADRALADFEARRP